MKLCSRTFVAHICTFLQSPTWLSDSYCWEVCILWYGLCIPAHKVFFELQTVTVMITNLNVFIVQQNHPFGKDSICLLCNVITKLETKKVLQRDCHFRVNINTEHLNSQLILWDHDCCNPVFLPPLSLSVLLYYLCFKWVVHMSLPHKETAKSLVWALTALC